MVFYQHPKKGFETILANKTLLEWGKIFLNLSKKGLQLRSIKNDSGNDESIFLKSIDNIVKKKSNKAMNTIDKFKKENNLDFLYEKA